MVSTDEQLALNLIIVVPVSIVFTAGIVFCVVGRALRSRHQQQHYQRWLRHTTYHPQSAVINGNDIALQPVPYPQYSQREYRSESYFGRGQDDIERDEGRRQRSRDESLAILEGAHLRPVGEDPACWFDAFVSISRAPEDPRVRSPRPSLNGWTMPKYNEGSEDLGSRRTRNSIIETTKTYDEA
ncbi:hypothetical protein BGX38DRAFT_476994 [Terfezia claveryi]|nr:hypothetical protein BGX38DRAFT_476994 [Terfezia claveryi]